MIKKSIIALAIFLVLYYAFLCPEDPFKTTDMPQALIGVWVTEAPLYAGRSIKIEKMLVTFDLGEYGISVYPIQKLKKSVDGDREFFEIIYGLNSESEQILRFEFKPSDGGSIHVMNQKDVVWTLLTQQ